MPSKDTSPKKNSGQPSICDLVVVTSADLANTTLGPGHHWEFSLGEFLRSFPGWGIIVGGLIFATYLGRFIYLEELLKKRTGSFNFLT
jgi:hypothetical protein